MLTAVLVPYALALVAPLVHRALGRRSSWVLAAGVLGVLGWFASQASLVLDGGRLEESRTWVEGLGIGATFVLDGLSLIFVLLILGMGALVLVYGRGYLGSGPKLARFQVLLLLFMGSMLGLVLAGDLILLFVFWEGTSITSYLLIGTKHAKADARAAARRAFLVTGLGGLALLVGLLMLGEAGGSFRLTELEGLGATIQAHPWYTAIVLLVCLGAFTKSAQVPFHFWLPGAMAAPTPVSSYLHSATMVKAGVYLLARFQPELGDTVLWNTLLSVTGAVTMLLGAVMAYGSRDLKAVLAYSTVSGLGTIVLMLGIGTALATKAAIVFLIVHALYKGALFMVAGIVDHSTGTRDLEELRGLRRVLPLPAACAFLGALSMAGMWPLIGFIAKELVYEAKIGAPGAAWVPTVLGVSSNVLIFATAALVGWHPFRGCPSGAPKVVHRPTLALLLGPMVLAVLGLLVGLFPGSLAQPFVQVAVDATHAEPTVVKLTAWHGITLPLVLSVVTVALGISMYLVRPHVLRATSSVRMLGRFGSTRVYEASLVALTRVARAQTRAIQHGVLHRHVLLAVVVTLVLAGWPLLSGGAGLPFDGFAGLRVHEAMLVLATLAACVAAARARRSLPTVLSLGIVGLALSLLFLGLGAPDVAMTQVAVETLTVLLFVRVIAHLPALAERSSSATRAWHGALAIAAGLLIACLVRAILALPHDRDLATWLAERSYPEAKGRNVVNVILVDFRALDTLGEVTVLAVAVIGVLSLIGARKGAVR
jgi:multicomponent Na+:H+ antiporter subunit A